MYSRYDPVFYKFQPSSSSFEALYIYIVNNNITDIKYRKSVHINASFSNTKAIPEEPRNPLIN